MKFGVREICDVVLKAKSDIKIGSHTFQKGEPVIYLDTAKTSTMESAATTVYAQGGRGNSRLIAWEGEKTLTFTVEDALLSPKGLAILSGADLIQADGSTGAAGKNVITAHTTQTIVVTENNTITIPGAKVNDKMSVYFMLLDGNGEMSNVPVKVDGTNTTISGNTITVQDGLVKSGDIVLIDYYIDHYTDATQIDITPDKFAGFYYLEASTLFRRQSDGVDLPAEFIIPKVKIQSNFTFTMGSSGDPSSFTFTMDAFPDYVVGNNTKKVLASIQILNADDNCDLTQSETEEVIYKRYKYNEDGCEYIDTGLQTSDDTDISGLSTFKVDLANKADAFQSGGTRMNIIIDGKKVATTNSPIQFEGSKTMSYLAEQFRNCHGWNDVTNAADTDYEVTNVTGTEVTIRVNNNAKLVRPNAKFKLLGLGGHNPDTQQPKDLTIHKV